MNQPGDDLEDEDELMVQRTEEELRAGTRERETGAMRVRKRVRTDREQISVPTRHEEVSVERVPVEEAQEASEAEIGEDEVVMPVTEEELVTEKRPVVKEEIRVRKDTAQDEEVVEEDVRKEEVDIDDQTTGRAGRAGRGTDDLDDEARSRDIYGSFAFPGPIGQQVWGGGLRAPASSGDGEKVVDLGCLIPQTCSSIFRASIGRRTRSRWRKPRRATTPRRGC